MNASEIKQLVSTVLNKTNTFQDVFSKTDKLFVTKRNTKEILENIKNSNKTIYIYPVEIRSKFRPKAIKTDLIKILEMIQIGTHKQDQELLERLLEQNTLMPNIFFENRKKYTPCGIFYHKKGRLGVRILNQIVLLTSKAFGLSKSDIQRIREDQHSFAFYRQIAPNSYYLLVRTINMHNRNNLVYQEVIENYYSNLIGAGKILIMPLNTNVPFSYDASMHLNISSKPFK